MSVTPPPGFFRRAAFATLLGVALVHCALYPWVYGTTYTALAIVAYALPAGCAAAFAFWHVAKSAGDERTGWGLLAVALTATLVADVTWNVVSRVQGEPGYPTLFDGPYLASYAFYVAGLGVLVSPLWRILDRRWALDAGAMLAVAAGLVWHFVLPRGSGGFAETSVSFAYLLLDLGFLGVAVSAIYRSRITVRQALLLAAAATFAIGDLWYYFQPEAFDGAWNVGLWLIAVAAVVPAGLSFRLPMRRLVRSGALPYAVVAVMAGVTLFERSRGHVDDLLIAGVAALCLVVARQFLSLRRALAVQREETAFREAVLESQSELGLAMVIVEAGRVVFANGAAERVTGLDAARLRALPSVQDLAFEADRDGWASWLAEPTVAGDIRLGQPDGQVVELEVVGRRLHGPGEPRLLIVGRDVTARRQAEAALAHAQKLEGLGALAGGVAHDFNNLLSAVLGNVGLLKLGELDDEARESVDAIESAARRGAELTRSLLDFARFQPHELRPEDLRACLTETVALARTALPPNVSLRLDASAAPVPIWGDRGQLVQAFLNLVINARDAIGEAGEIHVSVGTSASSAVVEVSDTGPGMDSETQGRIFEPFFTTKAPGAGTGLGLAISQRTIRDHRGSLEVRSEPGAGTTFTVILPLNAIALAS